MAFLVAALRPITRDEALAELRNMHGANPSEEGHEYADRILLRLLADPEIAAAFEAVPKWYA